jgi:hypothetical protein
MLKVIIPPVELFDEKEQVFINTKGYELQLEHSLVSLSKWESKWQKPFLTTKDKTTEETIDYIRCMTISQNVDPSAYKFIRQKEIDIISEYIDSPMTATTINTPQEKGKINKEVITAEIVYYWMIAFNIPFECQKWHLNRLLTLISVCNIKNQPKKKIGRREAMSNQRALNEARKAKFNTKG